MSQYSVSYHPELNEVPVHHCADILWSYFPLVRETGGDYLTYRDNLENEVVGEQGLVCTCNGLTVGALVFGDVGPDSHFPGLGSIVYYTVVNPDHPQATLLLYRELSDMIRREGGQWYQTTRRISATEFTSKYRRIHG